MYVCMYLFDCGAHHITTMKGQVIVNRNVKDENSSKNRIGFIYMILNYRSVSYYASVCQ